jgi:hypothetical protein
MTMPPTPPKVSRLEIEKPKTLYQTVGALFAVAFIVHIITSAILKQLIAQTNKTKNQLDEYQAR